MINTLVLLAKRNQSRLIRAGVVGALLCALPVVGLFMTRSSLPLMAAVIASLVIIPVAFFSPQIGSVAIILAAAFVRFSLPTGTAARIVVSLLMTVVFFLLWVVRMMVTDRKLYLKPSFTNVPLLAFILITVVSYVWSNAFRDPLVVVWRTWPAVQLGALAVVSQPGPGEDRGPPATGLRGRGLPASAAPGH